jgi:hypothetical protein
MTAQKNIVPMNASMRDSSLIPCRIAARMKFIVSKLGIEFFKPETRAAVAEWCDGNAPPTWAAWQGMQAIENAARFEIGKLTRTSRPLVQSADGSWEPAKRTAREEAAIVGVLKKAEPFMKSRAKVAENAAPTYSGNVVAFPVRKKRRRAGGGSRGPNRAA